MSSNYSLAGNAVMQFALTSCDKAGRGGKRRPARCPICTIKPSFPSRSQEFTEIRKYGTRGNRTTKPKRAKGSQALEFECISVVDLWFLSMATLGGNPVETRPGGVAGDPGSLYWYGDSAKEDLHRITTEWSDCTVAGLGMQDALINSVTINGDVETGYLNASADLVGDAPIKIESLTKCTIPVPEPNGLLFGDGQQIYIDDSEENWGTTSFNCRFTGFSLTVNNNVQQKATACGYLSVPTNRTVELSVVLCMDDVTWAEYCNHIEGNKRYVMLEFLGSGGSVDCWRFMVCGVWKTGEVSESNGIHVVTLTMSAESNDLLGGGDFCSELCFADMDELEACEHLFSDSFGGDAGDDVVATGPEFDYYGAGYDTIIGTWTELGDGTATHSSGFGNISAGSIGCLDISVCSSLIIKRENRIGWFRQFFYTSAGTMQLWWDGTANEIRLIAGGVIVSSFPYELEDGDTVSMQMCVDENGDVIAWFDDIELYYAAGANASAAANPNWSSVQFYAGDPALCWESIEVQ